MTNGEQKVLWRGVAAGTIVGLALGLMMACETARQDGILTTFFSAASAELKSRRLCW